MGMGPKDQGPAKPKDLDAVETYRIVAVWLLVHSESHTEATILWVTASLWWIPVLKAVTGKDRKGNPP